MLRIIGLILLVVPLLSFSSSIHAQSESDLESGCTIDGVFVETGLQQQECEALIALYDATDGPNWTNSTLWNTPTDPCNWVGLLCISSQSALILIDLPENGLSGSLPAELGNLPNLQTLDLGTNELTGSIPRELGNLKNLRSLRLAINNLSGFIPPELGQNTSLSWIELQSNKLTGPVPTELFNLPHLNTLFISSNELSGHIPPELGDSTSLRQLILSNNNFSGPLPAELGQIPNLVTLSLFNNDLSGSIPAELGNITSLEQLTLGNNNFSGSIPAEFGLLTNLITLSLHNNDLSGSFPAALGNMTSLRNMSLSNNSLSGSIPAEFGQIPGLTWLYLGYNDLSGPIPAELAQLTSLSTLSLPNNKLSGFIPAEIAQLPNLVSIYLSDNNLSGPIPAELVQLPRLSSLDLSENNLSGSIPAEFGNHPTLRILALDGNDLSGPVPSELFNLSNSSLFLSIRLRDNGCLTTNDAVVSTWLNSRDNLWDNGCTAVVIADADSDGIANAMDNCPTISNPDQIAQVGDSTLSGDACDDEDGDGVFDIADACPVTGAQDIATFYLDADGDGYTTEDTTEECIQPISYLISPSDDLDCNDTNTSINPGAIDVPGDGIDQDCSGADAIVVIADADNDTVPDDIDNCPAISNPDQLAMIGANTQLGDACDDEDNDGVFDNADECPITSAQGIATFYLDADGDGYTTADTLEQCAQPLDYLVAASATADCDDTNTLINPDAVDVPDDGIDQNCSGADAVGDTTGEDDAGNIDATTPVDVQSWGSGFNSTFSYEIIETDAVNGIVSEWQIVVGGSGAAQITSAWVSGYNASINSGAAGDEFVITNANQGYIDELQVGDILTFTVQGSGADFDDVSLNLNFVSLTEPEPVVAGSPTCSNPVEVTVPFTHDGSGSFCWEVAGDISYVNSWNSDAVSINGTDTTNTWSNSLPTKINGSYYIEYDSSVAWSHFEVR